MVARELVEASAYTDFAEKRGNAAFGFREAGNQAFLRADNRTTIALSRADFDNLQKKLPHPLLLVGATGCMSALSLRVQYTMHALLIVCGRLTREKKGKESALRDLENARIHAAKSDEARSAVVSNLLLKSELVLTLRAEVRPHHI